MRGSCRCWLFWHASPFDAISYILETYSTQGIVLYLPWSTPPFTLAWMAWGGWLSIARPSTSSQLCTRPGHLSTSTRGLPRGQDGPNWRRSPEDVCGQEIVCLVRNRFAFACDHDVSERQRQRLSRMRLGCFCLWRAESCKFLSHCARAPRAGCNGLRPSASCGLHRIQAGIFYALCSACHSFPGERSCA